MDLLDEESGKRLPKGSKTRWNFNSRVVNAVNETSEILLHVMNRILEEANCWDSATVADASKLQGVLLDKEFIFFLKWFSEIMPHVDGLFSSLQKRGIQASEALHRITKFRSALQHIANSIEDSDEIIRDSRNRENLKKIMLQCIDVIQDQITQRFNAQNHICAMQIVDPKLFDSFTDQPDRLEICFRAVKEFFPMIQVSKLKTELKVI